MFETPSVLDWNVLVTLPAVSLALGATILTLIDLFIPDDRKYITAWLAVIGVMVSFVLNLVFYNAQGEAFYGMFVADGFTNLINIVILVTTFIGIMLSADYMKRTGIERGEFYPLMLISASGMMFMAAANDLVMIFVALELLSIPLYIMAAFRYPEAKSEEAGVKYLILGAFASAFFVYGSALIYGATGTTNLPAIFEMVQLVVASESSSAFLLLLGAGLIIVGLGFKVAVVPFHMWTPDVYDGAPTPVTAFMSVGAKAGGFAALMRIAIVALPSFTLAAGEPAIWLNAVWLITAATLILGNFVALVQSNVKRLLAYSSIAHAGYIMMAVAAGAVAGIGDQAAQGAGVYLLAYAFTNLGAFAVVIAMEKDDGTPVMMDDFNGLSTRQPLMAAMMAVFMLSLTGIPLTGGFIGKWLVFSATVNAGLIWLAVIGVLTSIVSAFYYLRVVVNMYLREGEDVPLASASNYLMWGLYACFAGTLLIGIFPTLATNLSDIVAIAANIVP